MTYIGKRCKHGIDSATCFYCNHENQTKKMVTDKQKNIQKMNRQQEKEKNEIV